MENPTQEACRTPTSLTTTSFHVILVLMRPLTRSGRLVAAVEGLLYEVHGRRAPQVLLLWAIQPSDVRVTIDLPRVMVVGFLGGFD